MISDLASAFKMEARCNRLSASTRHREPAADTQSAGL